MRIWIQLFIIMRFRIRFRILLLIRVIGICDHWSKDPPWLNFEPPDLPIVSVHGSVMSL
jgi:hypothetical protein